MHKNGVHYGRVSVEREREEQRGIISNEVIMDMIGVHYGRVSVERESGGSEQEYVQMKLLWT